MDKTTIMNFRLENPDLWSCKMSKKFPKAEFRVLNIELEKGDDVSRFLEIKTKDIEPILDFLNKQKELTNINILSSHKNIHLLQIYSELSDIAQLLRLKHIKIILPFYFKDGGIYISLLLNKEQYRLAFETAKKINFKVDILSSGVVETITSAKAITKKQERVLRTAIETGYYEVPRKSSLREIAKKLSMSLSNAAELLQKAEATLIKQCSEGNGSCL